MSEGLRAGTVALVTGAGSGIGESTARRLAEAGCSVICAGRRLPLVESVAAPLGGHALQLDVTDPESVESLQDRLPEALRNIDVLVNNAGHDAGGRRRFDEGDAAEWAKIIDTNVTGLIRITRQVIPGMIARDHGHVVNIGSISGYIPYATGTIYAASKHAVHGFSESLRLDFAGTGVRVSEILPGMVRTEFALNRWQDPGTAEQFYQDYGTCLDPDDIACTVLFALQQPPHVVISQLVVWPNQGT